MLHADVAIVGAGPAGAVAARDLARAGARVTIFDGSHPREKSCGGGVTARALDLVGEALLDGDGQRIDAVTFEAGGRASRVCFPAGAASDADRLRVFARETFDAALLHQAVKAGALWVPARVTRITRAAGRWTIATARRAHSAAWLLGADGPAGIVRKQVFRPFERAQLSIAAGSYVDEAASADIVIGFVDEPPGYLWSFPRPGHLAVGACGQADETSTAALHVVTDRWLDRYPPAMGHPRRRYAWPIPSLRARDVDREQPAGDGWMLLGDAAGLVDPITREGIFFAVRSGMLAADALERADPARRYAGGVRDELHAELRRAAHLKAGFFRPRFTSLLIDALDRSAAIRAVMLDLIGGRQPYTGLKRRLLGTLEVGLMLRVLTGR